MYLKTVHIFNNKTYIYICIFKINPFLFKYDNYVLFLWIPNITSFFGVWMKNIYYETCHLLQKKKW